MKKKVNRATCNLQLIGGTTLSYGDRVVMEKEIPQHQYMSGGEMDAPMLAAMVDCTLLEIIVLGGRDQNGMRGE